MRRQLLLLLTLLFAANGPLVWAQSNDYFGGINPGGTASGVGDGDGNPQADRATKQMPKATDLSVDEKRMRKKYSSNIQHAKDLIAKGEDMERKGKKDNDKALTKKGKIYQEIGKKALSDLEANIPTPDPDLVREKKERDANPSQL